MKIVVISTFATDKLIYLDSGEVETLPGGPAHWIKETYRRLGVSPEFITGNKEVTVEMEVVGREPGPGKIVINGSKIVIPDKIVADGFIVNILDEFDLEQVLKLEKGAVLLDIAGYTRTGEFLQGRKSPEMPSESVRKRIDIIKASREEYDLMPKEWREEQQSNRVMLKTLGADGVDVWFKGEFFHLDAPKVDSKNVIGAGDTFGSTFLLKFLQDQGDVRKAAEHSIEQVAKLFMSKN